MEQRDAKKENSWLGEKHGKCIARILRPIKEISQGSLLFRFGLNWINSWFFFSFLKVFRKKDELKKEMNLSSFFYVIDGQWNWSHEVILKNIFVKDILKKNSRRKLLESLYIFTMYSETPQCPLSLACCNLILLLPVFFPISCNFPSTLNRTLCLNIPSSFDNRDLAEVILKKLCNHGQCKEMNLRKKSYLLLVAWLWRRIRSTPGTEFHTPRWFWTSSHC